jgi:hypothetical protein
MNITQDPATLVYQCCPGHCGPGCPTPGQHKRPCAVCLAVLGLTERERPCT